MTDDDVRRLLRLLMRQKVREAVRSLLAGNDTGCFTTEQYQAAYLRISKAPSLIWKSEGLAEQMLCGTRLVREVRPGVWAAKAVTP